MTGLDRFLQALQEAGLELQVEDMLDLFWLATRGRSLSLHVSLAEAAQAGSAQTPEGSDVGRAEKQPTESDQNLQATEGQVPTGRNDAVQVYPAGRTESGQPTVNASPVSLPAGHALQGRLQLARALRPFRQRWPSHTGQKLDELRTAEATAELDGYLMPVFRPVKERWFEVDVVLEDDPAISFWRDTLAGFCQMLSDTGAFRSVRSWRLRLPAGQNSVDTLDSACLETPGGARVSTRLLAGRGVRRLVFFVTHGNSLNWVNGRYARVLAPWSQAASVAILHLFDRDRWKLGALGEPHGLCHAPVAGSITSRLRIERSWWTLVDEDKALLPVPAIPLTPGGLGEWSLMQMARGRHSPVFLLDPSPSPGEDAAPPFPADDFERAVALLREFSPQAFLLAVYLSPSAFTIPVARLVQEAKFGTAAQPSQLADVLLSGLVFAHSPPEDADPNECYFEFHTEARAVLMRSLRQADAESVAQVIEQRVSDYMEQIYGRAITFRALVPDANGQFELPEWAQPFAHFGLSLLSLSTVTRGGQEGGPNAPDKPTPFRDPFLNGKTEGPEMVWLPGGTFMMGDDKSEWNDEKPAHQVTLSHFAVGKYPVTFEEYDAYCEATGRKKPDDRGWGRGRRPVIYVSWNDAQAYCQWLTEQTGREYRLLTEAQWEYACRAGSNMAYCFGDNEQQLSEYAWYGEDWDKGSTHPVGGKKPNEFGLHDLHGNVWEWVQDWYDENYYKKSPREDPSGPESGSNRVIRGGGWGNGAVYCRSACRSYWRPGYRRDDLGFRLARTGPLHSYPFTLPPPKPEPPSEPKESIAGLRDTLKDKTPGPAMVWLPGGVFKMGQDDSPYDDEKPAHEVEVSTFSIGQYPVTFEEYDKFCEATQRNKPNDYNWGRGTRPVVDISWSDAAAYCEWLSEQTREHYTLLTEAEWEYACRATSRTRYCYGDDEQRLGEYAWYSENAGGKTHPVGEKQPNAWQLYDMHGNVWEWVRDWYADDYYKRDSSENPGGPESGADRVIRGGSWVNPVGYCRSASRGRGNPGDRAGDVGFRLARTGAWPLDALTLGRRQAEEKPVAASSEPEPRYQPYQSFQDHLKDETAAPEMVYLPGETFKMGDIQGKGYEDERPVHEVTLDAFAIGQYPVTVGEFRRFVDATGYRTEAEREDGAYVWDGKNWGKKSDASWRNPYFSQDDRHPVVCVSWNDAAAYCEWLSEQTGKQYSLPTEAEWEYACRASSETAYFFGGDEKQLEDYAWYSKNSEGRTHSVGEKRANPWGLYDISGNVWEWVRDWYERYSEEPRSNPSGPESGSGRVFRGGGWLSGAVNCRSAYRDGARPGDRGGNLGFRLARRV